MAEGIRIRHETKVGPAVIAVRDRETPIAPTEVGRVRAVAAANALNVTTYRTSVWNECSACSIPETPSDHPMGHQGFKTRHITVDADGYAIVSEGVWAGLHKYVDDGGFAVINTVPDPPPVTMNFEKGRDTKITVHHKVPRELRSN